MCPGLTEGALEGVLFGGVGFVTDRTVVGEEKLQNGERKQREEGREKVKAEFREAVSTSQQRWALPEIGAGSRQGPGAVSHLASAQSSY